MTGLVTEFAGADWIRRSLRKEPSPLGEEVADILGAVFRGIYHLSGHVLESVDWSNADTIRIAVPADDMATVDCDALTRLVFHAHDRAVRVQLEPSGPYRIGLRFHQRQRSGRLYERHPTLEDAVEAHRSIYPDVYAPPKHVTTED